MSESQKAIIIGAGFGGMALANLLGKAGYSVEIFEKNKHAGGRISAVHQGGFTFDLGPSWYLMPEVFEQYYSLFDESAHNRLGLLRLKPGYRVFPEDSESIDIQGNFDEDTQVFETLEPGSSDSFQKYITDSKQIYDLSIKHFLYSNFTRISDLTKPVTKANAAQLIRLSSRSLHNHVGKYFKSNVLQQLLEYQCVFLGGSPFKLPAVYSLMSHLDFNSGIFYPSRGMQSLAEDMQKLGEKYNAAYHLNSPVSKIDIQDGSATGITLANGEKYSADLVISNADLHFSETKLLEKKYQTYDTKYWQKRESGPSAFIVSFGIKGALPELLHHNLYFVKNWRQNFKDIYDTKKIPANASMYICNPTKTDPSLAPKGHENIFVLVPFPAGADISPHQEQSLVNQVIEVLSSELNIPDFEKRIVEQLVFPPNEFNSRYNAWDNNAFGGESHLLKQSIVFRTKNKSRKVKNLFYVGAGTMPGIGLPMCLISAQLTFKQIHSITTTGPLTKDEIC